MDTQSPDTIVKVPVSKTGTTVEVNVSAIPNDAFAIIVMEGLKVMLGKKMSKITVAKLEGADLEKAQVAALEVAKSNLSDIMADKVKQGRAGSAKNKGVPGAVMTEARRLAKAVVKDQIRAAGMKISHVEASAITAAANELIASDPSYVEQATAAIAARAAKPTTIDIKTLVSESPKLVAKADAKKAAAKKDGTLSAKQAGKVEPRKKGQTAPTATMG